MKFVIQSFENMGMLTVAASPVIANNLAEGLGDCYVRTISPSNCKVHYEEITYNFIRDTNTALDKNCKTSTLNEITESYLQMKELARRRQHLYGVLYVWNEGLIARTNRFGSGDFIELARQAVLQSNPTTEQWHHWVLEHAAIQDLSPVAAYQDLKIVSDCEPEIRFRVNSLFLKWVKRINKALLEDLQQEQYVTKFLDEMRIEYWLNKEI